MTQSLAEKAMLVDLSIGRWHPYKSDKRVSREVAESHKAAPDAGRYVKRLLRHRTLDEFASIESNARKTHRTLTLPFLDSGSRLLPLDMWESYREVMRDIKHDALKTADEFCSHYAEAREEARARLGDLFNAEDYPPVDEVRRRFKFEMQIMPIANTGSGLPKFFQEHEQELVSEYEERLANAEAHATQDLWNRLYESVEAIRERLTNVDAVLREPVFEKLEDLVDLLEILNISGDNQLDKLAKEAKLKLTDVAKFRDDEDARSEAAAEAKKITDIISSMQR